MGLGIGIGIMADAQQHDPEAAEWIQEDMAAINTQLSRGGYATHNEPLESPTEQSRAVVDSFPYSFLHTLRRAYAHCIEDPGQPITPLQPGQDASRDPVLKSHTSSASHLIWHSDAEGYYVPVEFDLVIEDESLPGAMLGSSQRLLDELVAVAPSIGITLSDRGLSDTEAQRINEAGESEDGPFAIELLVWICLFEAARLSVKHGYAISFG